ncbi:MAG: RNA methyltransferase, partial [Dermatophilaceae bacterium]
MPELLLTSPANPRLKAVLALRRRRAREQEGRTLVDGYDELRLAVDAGVVPSSLLVCPELMLDPPAQMALVERVRSLGSSVLRCSRSAFEKVAYR